MAKKIVKQWVNLPKDEKFSEGEITPARCGKLAVKLTFTTGTFPLTYYLNVVPVGNDNVVYSEGEQARNPNFNLPGEIMGIATKKTVVVEGIQLPAAGGNQYKIEVEDENGNKVATEEAEIEVQRKLYYQVIVMDDANGSVPSERLATLEAVYLKHFITLAQKGAEEKISYIKTIMIGSGEHLVPFVEEVVEACCFDHDFNKLGLAVVFVDYLASMGQYKHEEVVVIGEHNSSCFWDAVEVTLVGKKEYLWHGLDDEHDNAKKWFISGEVAYIDPEDAITTYTLKREAIDISGEKKFAYGGYDAVKIKIDTVLKALLKKKEGVLVFTVEVNVVSEWSAGFSWECGGVNVIACAKRAEWEAIPADSRKSTVNHEVGHYLGMVAYGDKNYPANAQFNHRPTLPDAPSTLYGDNPGVNDYGHGGPHCGKGAAYNRSDETWSGTPGCVMFGDDVIGDERAPNSYCSECAPIVKKLDLSP